LDRLKSNKEILDKIDLTKIPEEGTAAWEDYNKALAKSNLSLTQLSKLNEKERIKELARIKENNAQS
jgi:hypothetical protein